MVTIKTTKEIREEANPNRKQGTYLQHGLSWGLIKEQKKIIPRIVKAIRADKFCNNKDYEYIGERYEYWKHQKNKNNLTYSFSESRELALNDLFNKLLFDEE